MKYRRTSNFRVYITLVLVVGALLILREYVMETGQRTQFNYKPELNSRMSIHLRNIVAARTNPAKAYIKPASDDTTQRIRPITKKMSFEYDKSDLPFPESIPGWGQLPQIDDTKWKLAVNSRLRDGADSPFIEKRRKELQEQCKSKNLGIDYYRIFEPRAIRYWDMLTEPAIRTAQRKLENFKGKRIIKNVPQGRGIVICRSKWLN
jgi:hypothetical protein